MARILTVLIVVVSLGWLGIQACEDVRGLVGKNNAQLTQVMAID